MRRAAIGLPAAQRTRADVGAAAGRRDQVPVATRDRGPQPGLQPLFGRDLAHLGILGEQGRLRPPADPNEERDAQVPPRSEIKARFLRAHQRVIPALRIEVGYPAGSQSEKSPTQPCTEAQTAAVEVGRPAPDQGQTAAPGGTDAGIKTIGLCMVVKNEAKLIRQCLTSALPLVDYVLVVDTGSEDGTQQIIGDFLTEHDVPGAVIDEPWRDFGYNRTFALERLREVEDIDYALIIDADDVVVLDAGFDPRAFKTQMEHDLYDVQILHGGMSHFRAQNGPRHERGALPDCR